MITCNDCGSQHQAKWDCHECARRSLMRRYPLPLPETLIHQIYIGLAKYLLGNNDRTHNQAFLDAWEHGRKESEGVGKAPAHGLASRQRIEDAMRQVWAERKAEAARLAVVF